jgi:hypothetical protein
LAGHPRSRNLRHLPKLLLEVTPKGGGVGPQLVEETGGQPVLLANQGDRQMLHIELLVSIPFSELLSLDQGFLGFDGQLVESNHGYCPS